MSPSDSQPPSSVCGPRRRRSGRSGCRRRVAHPHLALLPGRQLVAVAVADLHLAGAGATDRTAVLEPLDAGDDRGGLRLGAGVQLVDPLRAEPVDPRLLEPRRARLGEVPDDAQRRHVVAERARRRRGADALHHRRHEVDDVDAVALDRGERCLGVEALQEHDMVAAQPRLARPDRPARCGTAVRARACSSSVADSRAARAPRCRTRPGRPTRSASDGRSSRPTSGPSTPATRRRAAARRRTRGGGS